MTFQLALFVARSRVVRNAAILMLVVSAIAVGANGVVRTMQIPAWALADTMVGSAEYAMQLPMNGALPLRDVDDADAIVSAASSAGADGARIGYVGGFAQIDQTGETAAIQQQRWSTDPFPQGIILKSGRLPSGTAEAAVSPRVASESPVGATITLFHGALSLKVVGVVENQTTRFGEFVVIDDGTLEDLSTRSEARLGRYQVAFSPVLYWSGAEPADVAVAVAGAIGAPASSAEQLAASTMSYDDMANSSPPRLVEIDIAVTLLPFTAAIVAAWLMNRFLGRVRRTLIQLGVTRTVLSLFGTATVMTTLGSVIGGVLGLGVVYAARPGIAAMSSSVLDSPEGLVSLTALIATITAVATASTLCVGNVRASAFKRRARRTARRRWGRAAVGGAALAFGFALLQSTDINVKIPAVILVSAAICLMGSYALTAIPDRDGATAWVLAIRRIRGEGRGAAWSLITLSVLLSTGFTLATLYASDTVTSNELIIERVPVGQAYFEPAQPDVELLGAIQDFLGAEDPVEFAFIDASPVGISGIAMAVHDVDDLGRLIQRPLTPSERDRLESGGALLTAPGADGELHLVGDDGAEGIWPGSALEDIPPSFRRLSGIVLNGTAVDAGLNVIRHTWVFTDLTDAQRAKVGAAPRELGFEADWLEGYQKPDDYKVMDELYLTLAAILVIGMSVIMAYAAGVARAMRPRAAGLIAIGLNRRWLVSATVAEIGLIVLLSIAIAGIAAVAAMIIAIGVGAVPLTLAVPWDQLGVFVGSLIVVAGMAAIISTRRLRMVERQQRW